MSAGGSELWHVSNPDGVPHNFHVHGVHFRILELSGTPPPLAMRGPKDTVFVASGGDAVLLVTFQHHTDPDVPYMYHCHMLTHEDLGMMGQFLVLDPGRPAGALGRHHAP